MKKFDWIVVGGGIAGISIAEILTRQGHSVALVEKNKKLASVATREFHEWVHTGSLYTLVKDQMKTLKYILGSLDDLLEFYSSYKNMNLSPTEKGLLINDQSNGWFNKNYINFKYRLKNRKFLFNWMFSVARSIALIEGIKKHDWLRRRAGIIESVTSEYYLPIIKNFINLLFTNKKFYGIKSSDFTTNSRVLLKDLLSTSVKNGLEIFTENELIKLENKENHIVAICKKEEITAKRVVFCVGGGIEKFTNIKIKKSLAPIAVVKNVPVGTESFVELDYFKKTCINIITKGSSYGMIGGISLSDKKDLEKYFDYMIAEHKKLNPQIQILEKYIGVKNEIISKGENRSYIFHINQDKSNKNVWSVIPGKFSLAFSIAPEFYRLLYKKNPKKYFATHETNPDISNIIEDTVWGEIQNQSN